MVDWNSELGQYTQLVQDGYEEVISNAIPQRIEAFDHTVWQDDPEEISNRLGWLDIADRMMERLPIINALADSLGASDYTDVLLLGMGGSSLAPEVFALIFGPDSSDSLHLEVLDSTDADAVHAQQQRLDPDKTCFIVSTKSGGTVETLSFFKYFYNWVRDQRGADRAGENFVAITDPGSKLVTLANQYQFRHTYENDPTIGGRYSALSFFGLVPAACVGVDVEKLLQRTIAARGDDIAWKLGVILGDLAQQGRDKMTLLGSDGLTPFFDWVEQLVAESTGKEGKGILPVIEELPANPQQYGDDRLFVALLFKGDDHLDSQLDALSESGHPVVRIYLDDKYDLGKQFYIWELATAVAGARLGIHPFNQPNVESAKNRARDMVTRYLEEGELDAGEAVAPTAEALNEFLAQAQSGYYIAIQAYVEPTAATTAALNMLRDALRRKTNLATTVGYGPRFLHSTGQLHKGDGGNGLFIQFTSESRNEVDIPDKAGDDQSTMSFNVLKLAQALGDGQALADAGRLVIRFHIESDPAAAIRQLAES